MKIIPSDIACIILAAGSSTRFGSAKMHYALNDGDAILLKTMGIYAQVFAELQIVVRESDDALSQLVKRSGGICIGNHKADSGMSQSVIEGVKSTEPNRAWMIALGDMPYVGVSTIRSMVEKATANNIVVPRTNFGLGNPVVFGVDFEDQLLELVGDVGAKSVIMRNIGSVFYCDCEDEGVHHDIDFPEDILKTD